MHVNHAMHMNIVATHTATDLHTAHKHIIEKTKNELPLGVSIAALIVPVAE